MVHVVGAFVDIVRPRAVSPLLEPSRDRPVVLEGIIEAHPYLRFHQPVVDLLLSVVPLSPVSAQLSVSFFQILFVEGRLP